MKTIIVLLSYGLLVTVLPATKSEEKDNISNTTAPLKLRQRENGGKSLDFAAAVLSPDEVLDELIPILSKADVKKPQKPNAPLKELPVQTKQLEENSTKTATVANKTASVNDTKTEEMLTASAIVFRPLFAYRQQQAQKRKYHVPGPSVYNPVNNGYYPSSSVPNYHHQSFTNQGYYGNTNNYQYQSNQGYYIYTPQTGQYIHVPYGYPPVPAGHPKIPYQTHF